MVKRMLVHFVNLRGHADTAYFTPIAIRNVRVDLDHPFRRATAVRLDQKLRVATSGQYRRFTRPLLETYEVVVLDE